MLHRWIICQKRHISFLWTVLFGVQWFLGMGLRLWILKAVNKWDAEKGPIVKQGRKCELSQYKQGFSSTGFLTLCCESGGWGMTDKVRVGGCCVQNFPDSLDWSSGSQSIAQSSSATLMNQNCFNKPLVDSDAHSCLRTTDLKTPFVFLPSKDPVSFSSDSSSPQHSLGNTDETQLME